jgi:hypothetical protein
LISSNAMAVPAALEPGPLVTLVRCLTVAKAGPPRKNRSALNLGEADVQAETAQHPDEPEAGQEGPPRGRHLR